MYNTKNTQGKADPPNPKIGGRPLSGNLGGIKTTIKRVGVALAADPNRRNV